MIVSIDNRSLGHFKEQEWASLCYDIVKNGHFVQGDNNVINKIIGYGMTFCSSWQKALIKSWTERKHHITDELKTYLTTIDVNKFTFGQLHIILHEPSYLMVENLPYENIVYKSLIGIYKQKAPYKNLFILLEDAKRRGYLKFYHAGGYGNEKPLLEYFNKYDYKDVVRLKFCVLMDRDTESCTEFPNERDSLFIYLSGKDKAHLNNSDIYCFTSPANWHMWYKRAIENYFPERQYQNIGINTASFPANVNNDWSYREIKHGGYKKNKLPQLIPGMNLSDYEQELQQFIVNVNGVNKQMSEFELFLLKLVKII